MHAAQHFELLGRQLEEGYGFGRLSQPRVDPAERRLQSGRHFGLIGQSRLDAICSLLQQQSDGQVFAQRSVGTGKLE